MHCMWIVSAFGSARRVALPMFCAAMLVMAAQAPSVAQEKPPEELTFHSDIVPILKENCLRCHNARKHDGKLDVSTFKSLLKGGISGPPLVPGNSKKSIMLDMIFFGEMPPKKEKQRVSKEEMKRIEAWIDAGAPEGEKPAGTAEAEKSGQQ